MAGLYEVLVFIALYSGVVVSALWMTVTQKAQISEKTSRFEARQKGSPAA